MTGVAAGVAVSFFGVGGAFLVWGQGWGASIGMGAFVAFWGGLGFGGMIGGAVWAIQVGEGEERARLGARAEPSVGPEPIEPAPKTVKGGGSVVDIASEPPVKVAS